MPWLVSTKPTIRFRPTTSASTARQNKTTRRPVLRRAWSWCWKKSMVRRDQGRARCDALATNSGEGDFGGLARTFVGDLEELRRFEVERTRDEVRGEHLALRVVRHHRVVE